MNGLTTRAVEAIRKMIGSKFDSISLNLLGILPRVSKEKRIIFSTTKDNMISLFLQSLASRDPNRLEETTLKTMLTVASGYMDGLKERTSSRIIQDVDSYVKDQNNKKEPISYKKVKKIIADDMDKAKNHIKLIANAETNKAVNTGTALQIARIAEGKGEEEPTVFFIVTVDDVTGPEEFVLHLLPDRKTPRLWKLSEIGSGYHKVGDSDPKFPGLHPNCRCKLTYLAHGWGFDASGRVKFIDSDHDAFEAQRKEYGKPR